MTSGASVGDPAVSDARRATNRARLQQDLRGRVLRPSSYPAIVRMETTSRCQLSCTHCFKTRDAAAGEDMPLDRFAAIAEEAFPHIDCLELGLSGEPLHDALLGERLALLDASAPRLAITTSGDGLADHLDALLPHLSRLTISLEAVDPEVYEMVRRGADLRGLFRTLAMLRDRLRDLPPHARPRLAFRVTLFGGNHALLAGIVERLGREGADRIDLVNGIVLDDDLADQALGGWETDLGVALQRAIIQGQASGVQVRYPTLPPSPAYPPGFLGLRADGCLPDHFPWTHATVDVDGSLGLCCPRRLLRDSPSTPIGSDGFFAVWTGPRMQEVRRHARSQKACGFCPHAESRDDG